jgi:hypothetical protein
MGFQIVPLSHYRRTAGRQTAAPLLQKLRRRARPAPGADSVPPTATDSPTAPPVTPSATPIATGLTLSAHGV